MSLRRVIRWARDRAGATALEFALVLPPFVMLVFGGFYSAGLYFVASSMQNAVDAGARCAAINTSVCKDSTTTVTYVKSQFAASSVITPTFTATSPACGQQVTGTVTYVLDTGLSRISVPLSATACYP